MSGSDSSFDQSYIKKKRAPSRQDDKGNSPTWRSITNDDMDFVTSIATNLLIDLGLFHVNGDKWRNLVMAVFQGKVSAFGRQRGYSAECVKLDNRQLSSDEKNKMHASIRTAAKAHAVKKHKKWHHNSHNSASHFQGPITFEQEDHDAIMMAVVDVLLHHGAHRVDAFELWDMAMAIFETGMSAWRHSFELEIQEGQSQEDVQPRGPTG